MVVRAGLPKPDISTLDALRKTCWPRNPSPIPTARSGTYLSTVGFKKLGIADEVAGKSHKVRGPPTGEPVAAVVAHGEAEIGFQQVAELIHVPGADFVGTVPAGIQPPAFFVGTLPKNTNSPKQRSRCCASCRPPEAASVITKSGTEAAGAAVTRSRRYSERAIRSFMISLVPP